MKRRILLSAALVLATSSLSSLPLLADEEDAAPLQWSWRIETTDAAGELTLVATAKIADGYIVYGSDFRSGLGPRPSRLKLTGGAETNGDLASIAAHRRSDKTLGTEYSYFERTAEFRQKLRRTAGATHVTGRIDGQTCYEKDGTCALFREAFDLALP